MSYKMKKHFLFIMLLLNAAFGFSQTNIVTYAGGTGKETFYDVMQITDERFLMHLEQIVMVSFCIYQPTCKAFYRQFIFHKAL